MDITPDLAELIATQHCTHSNPMVRAEAIQFFANVAIRTNYDLVAGVLSTALTEDKMKKFQKLYILLKKSKVEEDPKFIKKMLQESDEEDSDEEVAAAPVDEGKD